MKPGRAGDLPALIRLWRAEVRAGRRDSVPREVCRLVEDGAGRISGAVLVTSRETSEGTIARVDPAADGDGEAQAMRDLVTWSLQLSRAAGAAAAQVWVGPGHGDVLRAAWPS
jgi:hypothetical protein